MKLITGNSLDAQRLNTLVGLSLWIGVPLLCAFFAALMGSWAARSWGEVSGALGSFIGGLIGGALAAYAAYLGVKTTLEGQAARDAERRAQELAAIRLALHTEVGMIALVCVRELEDWLRVLHSPGVQKDPRTARLPPLTVYNSVCGNIGRLTRDEIVPLIGFAGTVPSRPEWHSGAPVKPSTTRRRLVSSSRMHAARQPISTRSSAIYRMPSLIGDLSSASRRLIGRWNTRGTKPHHRSPLSDRVALR
jgi:hypothetical protein